MWRNMMRKICLAQLPQPLRIAQTSLSPVLAANGLPHMPGHKESTWCCAQGTFGAPLPLPLALQQSRARPVLMGADHMLSYPLYKCTITKSLNFAMSIWTDRRSQAHGFSTAGRVWLCTVCANAAGSHLVLMQQQLMTNQGQWLNNSSEGRQTCES